MWQYYIFVLQTRVARSNSVQRIRKLVGGQGSSPRNQSNPKQQEQALEKDNKSFPDKKKLSQVIMVGSKRTINSNLMQKNVKGTLFRKWPV